MMITIVLVLGYLSFLVLRPFFAPIGWAIVLSIVFYPFYAFVLRYVRVRSLAALIALLVIFLLILGPFSYFSYLLASELGAISIKKSTEDVISLLDHPLVKALTGKFLSLMNTSQDELHHAISVRLGELTKSFVTHVPGGLGDVAGAFGNFVFMLFSLFFFLRDGADILEKARDYMPFGARHKHRLAKQVKDIVISTIYGGVAVAAAQGIIAAVAFLSLGVPAPILWGFATALCSFLPLVGSFIVWGPVTVYLLLKASVAKGIIMAVVGVFGISMVDNILRPIIIGGRTSMPMLLIFFSVFGGIQVFGLLGFILGPLVVALFFSVMSIFRDFEHADEP